MSRPAISFRLSKHLAEPSDVVSIAAGAASLLALSLTLVPIQARAEGGITGPTSGVICDQSGGACYDRQGPSISLTQAYLGSIAAARLTDALRNKPASTEFRLSNGAQCDTRVATCWKDGWRKTQLAPWLTTQLFGALPSAGGSVSGAGLQGLQAPRAGVVCDPAGQVCYDKFGLSLGLTRQYFGAIAEQNALRNLNGQAPPRQFRLSEGSACDVTVRTCWSDGWSRTRVNAALSQQLFGVGAGSGGGQTVTGRPAGCRITRWFKVLYNGPCQLQESSGHHRRGLIVQLQDRTVYSVSRQRSGAYQLTDPDGAVWPLQVRDQGTNMSLTWSDRVLTITPQNRPSAGTTLLQLINSLLGQ